MLVKNKYQPRVRARGFLSLCFLKGQLLQPSSSAVESTGRAECRHGAFWGQESGGDRNSQRWWAAGDDIKVQRASLATDWRGTELWVGAGDALGRRQRSRRLGEGLVGLNSLKKVMWESWDPALGKWVSSSQAAKVLPVDRVFIKHQLYMRHHAKCWRNSWWAYKQSACDPIWKQTDKHEL